MPWPRPISSRPMPPITLPSSPTIAIEAKPPQGCSKPALKGDAPFAHRDEAQKLYDRLTKKPSGPARSSAQPPADRADAAKTAAPKSVPVKAPSAKAPAKAKAPTP